MKRRRYFKLAAAIGCGLLMSVPTWATQPPTLSEESIASGSLSIYDAVRPKFFETYTQSIQGNLIYFETSDHISDDDGRYYQIIDSGILADSNSFSNCICVQSNPQMIKSITSIPDKEGRNCFEVTLSPDYLFERIICDLNAEYTAKKDLEIMVRPLGQSDAQPTAMTIQKGAKLISTYRLNVDAATIFFTF